MRENSLQSQLCLAFYEFQAQIMHIICLIYHFWENFENKNIKIKKTIFSLSFEDSVKGVYLLIYYVTYLSYWLFFILCSTCYLLFTVFSFFIFFPIFCFSATEYAYNMLSFLRNLSLNMFIVVMLIKKKGVLVLNYFSKIRDTSKRKLVFSAD